MILTSIQTLLLHLLHNHKEVGIRIYFHFAVAVYVHVSFLFGLGPVQLCQIVVFPLLQCLKHNLVSLLAIYEALFFSSQLLLFIIFIFFLFFGIFRSITPASLHQPVHRIFALRLLLFFLKNIAEFFKDSLFEFEVFPIIKVQQVFYQVFLCI